MNDSRRDSSFRQSLQSFSGASSGGGGVGLPALSLNVSIRDPRPVKEKAFQRTLIHNLVNFLTQAGYQHPVTAKNLTQPTNKDFQDIFKFLYQKLEPGYDFPRKFEDEVPILLRTMRYPAADTITKTSLYTVGTPHSWPNMLALLGWMMDVIVVIEKFKESLEAALANPASRDRDLDPRLDMTQVNPMDALYYYLIRTYRIWMLTGNLQDPDFEAQMALSFQKRKEFADLEIKRQKEINAGLRQEVETLRAEVSPLVALDKEQQDLQTELERMKVFIEHGEPRVEQVQRSNADLNNENAAKEIKLADLERAKAEVQEIVRAQTTTRAGLESKIEERNRLKRREDNLKQQQDDLENEIRTLEEQDQNIEMEAERMAKEYNAMAVKIGIVPSTAKYANGQDYELTLHLENARSGSGQLYSIDIKGKAERTISALRVQLTKSANETSDQLLLLREELERLKDQIDEYNEELNSKEYHLGLMSKKFQEEKETARVEQLHRQAFAESQKEDIQMTKQETIQNQAENERLVQECILLERQAAQNREMYAQQIKETLVRLTVGKQHVEQQIGLVMTMAHKELEDTQQQWEQVKRVLEAESASDRNRSNGEPEVVDRELLFSVV
ncbi:kinetochore-associated Ndc80 complex subunit ndc80 [Dissophora globulifera]|uniref:Kinetochore protein NDC80 n=1 Tax=Dissophora globulifera TaxID=979702 RepID=A0A9P6RLQ3_9FUNG|nr:kinetochore-associated Ndc80 complex subunit ndc80 [Dissophora globulifera]